MDSSDESDAPPLIEHRSPDLTPSPDSDIRETLSEAGQDASSGSQASLVSGDEPDDSTPGTMSSRAYQLEMLNQSLKQNVIVAVRAMMLS